MQYPVIACKVFRLNCPYILVALPSHQRQNTSQSKVGVPFFNPANQLNELVFGHRFASWDVRGFDLGELWHFLDVPLSVTIHKEVFNGVQVALER